MAVCQITRFQFMIGVGNGFVPLAKMICLGPPSIFVEKMMKQGVMNFSISNAVILGGTFLQKNGQNWFDFRNKLKEILSFANG